MKDNIKEVALRINEILNNTFIKSYDEKRGWVRFFNPDDFDWDGDKISLVTWENELVAGEDVVEYYVLGFEGKFYKIWGYYNSWNEYSDFHGIYEVVPKEVSKIIWDSVKEEK